MTLIPSPARVRLAGTARWICRFVVLAGLISLSPMSVHPTTAATLEGRLLTRGRPVIGGLSAFVTPVAGGETRRIVLESDGSFRLDGLPVARVAVVVGSDEGGLPEAARVLDLSSEAVNRVTLVGRDAAAPAAPTYQFNFYRGEYYADKSSAETADPVSVAGPQGASGINLDLASAGGTIAGRVTADADGAPIPGLIVFALGQTSSILSFDRTDANGNYQITGIPADAFYVSINSAFFFLNDNDFVGEFYNNSPTLLGATPVAVAEGQNVTDINFGLTRGGNITGRITAEQGGAGLEGVLVGAAGVLPLVVNRLAITDENGLYNIRALPQGSYRLRFQPDGNYIEEYFNNKTTETTADPVAVTTGNPTSGIDAALATGGRINGRIRATGSLAPIPGVVVAATRTGEIFSYQAETAADGSYVIEGLSTGSYAVGVPELSRWYDNRDDQALADPVVVTAGQTRTDIDITATVVIGGCGVDPQSRVNLSGRVVANGQPVEDADVILYTEEEFSPKAGPGLPAGRIYVTETTTNANGIYAFECLDVGTYFVECVPSGTDRLGEWYADADSAGATALTFIFGGTRTDIDFDLATGSKITGRVTTEGGATGLAFIPVYARNVATGEDFDGLTESNGNYTIDSGPSGGLRDGNYQVWVEDFSTANIGLVPIVLTRFAAVPTPEGIALDWETTAESGVVGFHVERADSPAEAPRRLTDALITGRGAYQHVDVTARPGISYAYWLVGVDRGGRQERFGPLTASFGESGITRLLGVFPNPLTSSATVHFNLGAPGRAQVAVFDPSGRRIRQLLDTTLPAGASSLNWDGRTDLGAASPAGVYFVRVELGGIVDSRKIIVRR